MQNNVAAPTPASDQLRCALTGRSISPGEAYWAPPLVTARDLVTTVLSTAVRAPGNLSHVLFDEQPNVPYAPEAREQLAARRGSEQVKLLAGLLALIALVTIPILLIAV